MSYFFTPLAEYRAKRITQMLASTNETNVQARRNGNVLANINGHMHLFGLDNGQLKLLESADLSKPKQEVVFTIPE